jgi:adenine deaminase
MFIVPLNFPTLPKWPSEDDWEQATLDQLRAWDWASENPALLRQQGREIALTTYGLSDKKSFRKNLRLALDRGLSEDDALAALTTVPAKLCGVEKQLGTIEKGKIANLTVVDGKGYFDADDKVRDVWIDGRVYRGAGEGPAKPKADEERESKPKDPEEGAPKKEKAKAEEKKPPPKVAEETKKEAKPDKKAELRELQKKRLARSPLEGRGPIAIRLGDSAVSNVAPPSILIQSATIWTCGPQGMMTNASLLISGGKIKEIGDVRVALQASQSVLIDGRGLHVTPGLIDAHSHTAIVGSVNEGSLPSSAMCRIGDVVNSETKNIFEQLAGG